jgi:hypothetical protein
MGCTLSVERLLPHFELAYFTGRVFPPNSDVSFDGQSYDEKHPVKTKSDSEGNVQFALMPFVSGRQATIRAPPRLRASELLALHQLSLSGGASLHLH